MKTERLCGWHPQNFGSELVMGEAETASGKPTHGICEDCRKKSFPELEEKKRDREEEFAGLDFEALELASGGSDFWSDWGFIPQPAV